MRLQYAFVTDVMPVAPMSLHDFITMDLWVLDPLEPLKRNFFKPALTNENDQAGIDYAQNLYQYYLDGQFFPSDKSPEEVERLKKLILNEVSGLSNASTYLFLGAILLGMIAAKKKKRKA